MPWRALSRWLGCLLLTLSLACSAVAGELLQLYREALSYDARFAAVQAEYRAGREALVQGRSGLLPSIGLDAQGLWSDKHYELAAEEAWAIRQRSSSYSVQLVQPLFRWRNWVQYRQGQLQTALAASRLESARQELLLRVAEAYFAVLSAQDIHDAVSQLYAAEAEQLAGARRRFELGDASRAEVHEAQAAFDRTAARQIEVRADLEVARHALMRTVGGKVESLEGIGEGVVFEPPQPPQVDEWIMAARQDHPDVQAQELLREISVQEVRSRKAEHLPTLDLVVSQGMQENPDSSSRRTDTTGIGLRLSLPLYEGGALTSSVREGQALAAKAEADLEDARRAAELETREAWLRISSGIARIEALEAARLSSQASLESSHLGQRLGVRSMLDVLDAQSQLADTLQQLSQARYDTLLSKLRLKAATGALSEADLRGIDALSTGRRPTLSAR